MYLRLANKASLIDLVDRTGRKSKRTHSFADNRHKAKRQHVSDTQRSKRKHSGAARPDLNVGPDIFRPEAEAGLPDVGWRM